MKRVVIAEAEVVKTFSTLPVAQNKIGYLPVNGADSYFTIAAGDTPLVCNMFMRLGYASDIAARAAAAEIMVFPTVTIGANKFPTVSVGSTQYLLPDDLYPQNIVAVAVNPDVAARDIAEASFTFPVLTANPFIAVRNINSIGLSILVAHYNLIQIK